MSNQPPDPEMLEYIKTAWKNFILPGERLETADDLDRLQTRVKGLLRLKSERLEQQLTQLTEAMQKILGHQQRLAEASKQLQNVNKELTKFANVVQRSFTGPN